ncbi:galactose oxidase [Sinomicrobium kalidii]|uniref:Kelch repeat-containing protein n=1 Tax=Sinomicrobium kalidii TaxID=2900738 RepID=UPI001E35B7E4|nr:kelch repeat-containing protein [Sinomicrobium kalidii]UGU14754.1 galactose oxidase [Sinomicrobium kalidii]
MRRTTKRDLHIILYSIPLVFFLVFLAGCSSDDEEDMGNWEIRSVFDGKPRSSSAYFSIGNKGYTGTGYDGDDYRVDFWEYDMEGDYWVQKADFPGTARSAATAFAVDGKGYIGSGYDGVDELGDFYAYNPSGNTWTSIADFPERPRREALAFAANGYGYFGTGTDGDNDRKDFWRYDPASDTWTELFGFGGDKRRGATSFSIDGNVYMGTGVSNGVYLDDFWRFDPGSESWTKLLDLDEEDDYSIIRSNGVGFSIGSYGYIACGTASGSLTSVWEYDPAYDTWERKTGFEGTSRQSPVVFSNGARAFVGLGRSGNLYLDDLKEFFPWEEYDEDD